VGAKVNPDIMSVPLTLSRYKMDNYLKEIFLDSDTKMSLLSGAPFDDPSWWLLSNDAIQNCLSRGEQDGRQHPHARHTVITPKVSELDGRSGSRHRGPCIRCPWKVLHHRRSVSDPPSSHGAWTTKNLMYPFYEKAIKSGHSIPSASTRG